MNDNFARAHNQYLEPPDEPEAKFCEDCGTEMDFENNGQWADIVCKNLYCPSKHEGVAKEMAELLIGAQEEVKSLARKIKRLEHRAGI